MLIQPRLEKVTGTPLPAVCLLQFEQQELTGIIAAAANTLPKEDHVRQQRHKQLTVQIISLFSPPSVHLISLFLVLFCS